MRINKNDHLRENALIFYQILSTHSLRKCIEIRKENLYMYTGAQRVKWSPWNNKCLPRI